MGTFYSKSTCLCPDSNFRCSINPEGSTHNIHQLDLDNSDNEITEFERCDELSSSSPTGLSNFSQNLTAPISVPSIRQVRVKVVSRNAMSSSMNLVLHIRKQIKVEKAV